MAPTRTGPPPRHSWKDLVERGIDPSRRYLFGIDGSKALRSAIDRVFGKSHPVQRCRNHKFRNVTAKLPEEQQAQVRSLMKAAFRLPWKEGVAKLRKQADAKKVWTSCSPSIGSSSRLRYDSAWGRRTSSTVPTPESVSEPVGSVDGGTARWGYDGPPRLSWLGACRE